MATPEHTIDLRLPPEARWSRFAFEHKSVVRKLLKKARRDAKRDYSATLIAAVETGLSFVRRTYATNDYVRELSGFADAADVDVDDLYLANVLYDLTVWGDGLGVGCTSMVHSGPPHPMIARNMDWATPDGIGAESVVFRFVQKGGEYLAVGFPGVIGVVSGLSSHGFAMTVNQAPGALGLLDIPGALNSLPVLWITRSIFDGATSYRSARRLLSTSSAASSAFYLMAGSAPGEASIIRSAGNEDWPVSVRQGRTGVVANHWEENREDTDSVEREATLSRNAARVSGGDVKAAQAALDDSPVLNEDTVHQMVLVPATGRLELRCPQRGERRYSTFSVTKS